MYLIYLMTQVSNVLHNMSLCVFQGVPKKRIHNFIFWDNFGNSARILTILSLLPAEIYGA